MKLTRVCTELKAIFKEVRVVNVNKKREIIGDYCFAQTCKNGGCVDCKLNIDVDWDFPLNPSSSYKCLSIGNASEADLDKALAFIGYAPNVNVNNDPIAHPAHYCYSKYEPKDVIRDWGLNFNLGSAVKYISRAGRKEDIVQDLKKAVQFLSFEIEALKNGK